MMGWLLLFDDGRHRWEVLTATTPPTTLGHLDFGRLDGDVRWKRVTISQAAAVAAFYPEPEEVPA